MKGADWQKFWVWGRQNRAYGTTLWTTHQTQNKTKKVLSLNKLYFYVNLLASAHHLCNWDNNWHWCNCTDYIYELKTWIIAPLTKNIVDFTYAHRYFQILQNYGKNSWTHMFLDAQNFSAFPRTQKKREWSGRSNAFEGTLILQWHLFIYFILGRSLKQQELPSGQTKKIKTENYVKLLKDTLHWMLHWRVKALKVISLS